MTVSPLLSILIDFIQHIAIEVCYMYLRVHGNIQNRLKGGNIFLFETSSNAELPVPSRNSPCPQDQVYKLYNTNAQKKPNNQPPLNRRETSNVSACHDFNDLVEKTLVSDKMMDCQAKCTKNKPSDSVSKNFDLFLP